MKWVLLFLLITLLTPCTFAQEFNAGLINGLWYSQEKIFTNEPVRIYVAIRNNTGEDLTGRVEFYDNNKVIGRAEVSALDGRIVESWTDWIPDHGEHTLSASLSRTELSKVGSSTKAVEVTSALAEDIIFVDYDTDKDGVGNVDDIDDDGDGISDTVEEENNTNPLVFNEKQDNINQANTDVTDDGGIADATRTKENRGFEQYLTPSPAYTALSNFTDILNTTKQNIDTYREVRQEAETEKTTPPEIFVNEDGFGQITRTTNNGIAIETPDMPEIKEGSFLNSIILVSKNIWSALCTATLASVSFYLGHAIFVQLTILFGILFALYKLARKFGKRPS